MRPHHLDPERFLRETTSFTELSRSRSGYMTLIDEELKDIDVWWDRWTDDQRREHLLDLVKKCKRWNRSHVDKQARPGSFIERRIEQKTYEFRRPTVGNLVRDALIAFGQLPTTTPGQDTAFIAYERRKAAVLFFNEAPGSRTLDEAGGFLIERLEYLQNLKQASPYAGGRMQITLRRWSEKLEAEGEAALTGIGPGDADLIRSAVKKSLAGLSIDEYEALGRHALSKELYLGWDRQYDVKKSAYLSRAERLRYLLHAHERCLACRDGQGQAYYFDTGDQAVPYAIDRYGNIFSSVTGVGHPGEILHHSSFTAGDTVLCAGLWIVQSGWLIAINNNSGHYKPDDADLRAALRLLSSMGVCLDYAEVEVLSSAGATRFGPKDQGYPNNARAFMRDPKAGGLTDNTHHQRG